MTTLARLMAAAAMAAALAVPAQAQDLNAGARGTFGQISLRSGFQPDPHAVTVNAGGGIDASTVSSSCNGFVDSRPSFTLRYRAGEYPLFIGASADADTTILVRAPDGSWSCNDDSNGLNPMVSWDNPGSGRYQIWVGRYGAQGETAPAVLSISEVAPAAPQAGETAGGPDFSLDPAYGSVELTAGFQPDPHQMQISAGGAIDASTLGISGCVGWIAQAPDYRVHWTAGSGQLPLVFSVNAEADTTLVINDAAGNWVCDDDGGNNNLNPAITFQNAPSGQYDIWVGTYAQGDLQPSVLNVSELYSE